MRGLLLADARLIGRAGRWRITVRDGRIAALAPARDGAEPPAGHAVVPVDGRLVVPGFHDPHVHVLAAARERAALTLPARLDGWPALARLLAAHAATLPPGAWLTVRRFDEATMTAGAIPDRALLDRLLPDRPVRLRHRNLRLDVLNSAALRALGLDGPDAAPRDRATGDGGGDGVAGATSPAIAPPPGTVDGIERDAAGRPTGRLHQRGPLLRDRTAPPTAAALRADVAAWSRAQLAAGVTAIHDAGEHNGPEQLALLHALARDGTIRQRLWTMADGLRIAADRWDPRAGLAPAAAARLVHAKLAPVEARLDLDALCAAARAARRLGLGVAVHATSEAELAAAVAALAAAADVAAPPPPVPDRIEHACVATDGHVAAVAAVRATVVANPALVREAGDGYLAEHPPADHRHLHRLATWRRAGVPLALASDAPVTASPPLAMVAAAVDRRTARGRPLGPDEALTWPEAIDGATAAGAALVGRGDLGRVAVGAVADLAVVAHSGDAVDLTLLGGAVAHVGDALRDHVMEERWISA